MKTRCLIKVLVLISMMVFAVAEALAAGTSLLSVTSDVRRIKISGDFGEKKKEAIPGSSFSDILYEKLDLPVISGKASVTATQSSQLNSTSFQASSNVSATFSHEKEGFTYLSSESVFEVEFFLTEEAEVTISGSLSKYPTGKIYMPSQASFIGTYYAVHFSHEEFSQLITNIKPLDFKSVLPRGAYSVNAYLYTTTNIAAKSPSTQSNELRYNFTLTATPTAPPCKALPYTPLSSDPTTMELEWGQENYEKLHSGWQYGQPFGLYDSFIYALFEKTGFRTVPKINAGYRTCEYQNHLSEISKGHRTAKMPDFLTKNQECGARKDEIDQEYLAHFGTQANAKASNPYNPTNKAMHTAGAAIDVDIATLGLSEAQIREVLNRPEFKTKIKWGRDLYPNAPDERQEFKAQSERQHFELATPVTNPCLAPKNMLRAARSSPPVQVSVSRELAKDQVTYHYSVVNQSTQPLAALYIGYDSSTGADELFNAPMNYRPDNYSPHNSFFSPLGWGGMVLDVLDTPYYNLFWHNSVEGSSIPPGASLSGFKVVLPRASAEYFKGHFTAVLVDGSEVSGPLLAKGVSVPYELLLPD
jgi:hypothetical protein